jgi:hypothetical protein
MNEARTGRRHAASRPFMSIGVRSILGISWPVVADDDDA